MAEMLPLERLSMIKHIVLTDGRTEVNELVQKLHVSSVTIRRDLKLLEEEGFLRRTHGGAVRAAGIVGEAGFFEPSLREKEAQAVEQKVQIGALAASLIADGQSVLLSAGTTTLEVAKALKQKKRLTVVTNAVNIALELSNIPGWTVVLTGGELRERSLAMVGHFATSVLQETRVDYTFLGANSINLEIGLMTPNLREARTNYFMLKAATRRVVVADSSKFGKQAFSVIAPLSEVDTIITDGGLADETKNVLLSAGIEVLIAN